MTVFDLAIPVEQIPTLQPLVGWMEWLASKAWKDRPDPRCIPFGLLIPFIKEGPGPGWGEGGAHT